MISFEYYLSTTCAVDHNLAWRYVKEEKKTVYGDINNLYGTTMSHNYRQEIFMKLNLQIKLKRICKIQFEDFHSLLKVDTYSNVI